MCIHTFTVVIIRLLPLAISRTLLLVELVCFEPSLGSPRSSLQLFVLKKHICIVPTTRATYVKSVELTANFPFCARFHPRIRLRVRIVRQFSYSLDGGWTGGGGKKMN
jgi:hypothetical protein